MKKIALFSLMVCLGGVYCVPALAVGNCGTTILHLDGDQRSDHDEFLYTDKRTLEKALNDYTHDEESKNAMHYAQYNLPWGYVLECDKKVCPHNSFVYLPNTGYGAHYNAAPTAAKFFLCDGADDDEWIAVQVEDCSDSAKLQPVKKMYKATNSGVEDFSDNREYFRIEYGPTFRAYRLCKCPSGKHYEPFETETYHGRCISDDEQKNEEKDNNDNNNNDDNNNQNNTSAVDINQVIIAINSCVQVVNGDSVVNLQNCAGLEKEKQTCEEQHPGNVELINCCLYQMAGKTTIDSYYKCHCTNPEEEWNKTKYRCEDKKTRKSCKESRSTAEGKACCDIPAKEAKWKDNQCKCLDEGKEFKIVAGAGQCVAKQQGGSTEFSDCYYKYNVSIKCANGNTYREKGSELLTKTQLAGFTCADFNARFETDIKKWQDLYGDLCKAHNADKPQGPSEDELSGALNRIESFTKYAESNKSVWKDSEGKFNTARLASDLTAGVVLGTVGGVVSGVVIKKKQIEKGFEVLHCTVGGQKIADWGDTFNVGFKR